MPNPSELARIDAERDEGDPAARARSLYELATSNESPAVRAELRRLFKQEGDDLYAAELAAASRRRREQNSTLKD